MTEVIEFKPTAKNYSRIQSAISAAKRSIMYPYRMAAVVYSGGRPILVGVNKPKIAEIKDPRYNKGRFIHAELNIVLQAAKNGIKLKGTTIYIGGLTKNNNLVCSKPCSLCQIIIKEAGIKEVFYHEQDGSISRIKV